MGTFYKPLIVLDLAFMNFNVILIWVIFLIYICRSLIRECISVWLRSFTLKAGRSEALRTILRTYYSSEFMLLSPNPETLVTLIVVQWNKKLSGRRIKKFPKPDEWCLLIRAELKDFCVVDREFMTRFHPHVTPTCHLFFVLWGIGETYWEYFKYTYMFSIWITF